MVNLDNTGLQIGPMLISVRILLLSLIFGGQVWAQGPNECPEELFPKYDKKARLYGYANWLGEYKVPAVYLRAGQFDGRFARVQLDKKQGIINCEGIMVVQAVYDEIGPLTYGKAFARNGDSYKYVDATGRTATNEYFQDVAEISDHNLQAWVKQKDKWALFDKETARLRTQPHWDAVTPISDSASIVRLGNQFGLYNNVYGFLMADSFDAVVPMGGSFYSLMRSGRWGVGHALGRVIVKPLYDSVKANNGMVYAYLGGKVNLLNYRGKLVLSKQNYVSTFTERFAVAQVDTGWALLNNDGFRVTPYHFDYLSTSIAGYMVAGQHGKFGFYLPNKKEFLNEPNFEQLSRISKGPYYLAKRRGLYFFIDPKRPNDALERQKFDSVALTDSLNQVRVWLGRKIHFFDVTSAKLLSEQGFADASPMRWGSAFVKQDSTFGIWSRTMPVSAVAYAFDSLGWLQHQRTMLILTYGHDKKGNSNVGIADLDGKTLLANEYETIAPVTNKQFKVRRKGKWGVASVGGAIVLEPKYDELSNSIESVLLGYQDRPEWPAIAKLKGKTFLINDQGEQYGTQTFDKITYLGEGIYVGQEGNKPTLISTRGLALKTAEPFDSIGRFEQKLAIFKLGGKYGFITIQGKYQIPALYEAVYPFTGRSALVKLNGLWGAIDRSNNWLMKPTYNAIEVIAGRRRLVNK